MRGTLGTKGNSHVVVPPDSHRNKRKALRNAASLRDEASSTTEATRRSPWLLRGGPDPTHDFRCANANVIECAREQCQRLGRCKDLAV
jgi:hypothetical protein